MGARPLPVRALIAAALAAAAVAGCGEGQIDTAKVEDEVAAAIERRVGTPVATVACPDDVALEEGATFRCTATGEGGGKATVTVTQVDDEGTVRFESESLDALVE